MNKHNTDNTFLAKWISGELSLKELEAFKKTKEYKEYKKINDASQLLQAPAYESKVVFDKIQQKTNQNNNSSKVVKLIPKWMYAAAASVVVLFGIVYFMGDTIVYKTAYGEQLAIVLPDNSKVNLNANSVLKFKKKNWNKNRNIKLNGEAFFKVEKGSSFTVETSNGSVEVLGTRFTVVSQKDYFEVLCYEGKVGITVDARNDILNTNDAYRSINNTVEKWNFLSEQPSWLTGESTYKNAPLKHVIQAIENQFNIQFIKENINEHERFTGSFTHQDVNVALKTVFVPMNISFTFKDDKTVLIVKK